MKTDYSQSPVIWTFYDLDKLYTKYISSIWLVITETTPHN